MLSLEEHLPKFCAIITDEIQMQCSAFIRQVSDIPRLYRRTNREVRCHFVLQTELKFVSLKAVLKTIILKKKKSLSFVSVSVIVCPEQLMKVC